MDDSLTSIKKQRDEIKTNIHDEDLQKEKNKELDTQEKQINKLKKGRVGLGKAMKLPWLCRISIICTAKPLLCLN